MFLPFKMSPSLHLRKKWKTISPFHVISSFLVITCLFLACEPSISQASGNHSLISAEALLQDLDTLKVWIAKAHGDPYRFTEKIALEQEFATTKEKVKKQKALSGESFAGIVMPIIAALKDGHARVFLPNYDHFEGHPIFPLRFVFINKKPFIIEPLASEGVSIGAEILEINGQSAASLFNEIIPILPRDGDIESIRYRKLQNQSYFTQVLIALNKATQVYDIKLRTNGQISSHIIQGLTSGEYNKQRKQSNKTFQPLIFDSIDSLKHTALLDINSLNPSYFQKANFYQQIDQIFQALKTHEVQHLIIDLRNNTGGEDSYVLHLLQYLLKAPFEMHGEVSFTQNNYKFLPDGRHWDIDPKCFKVNKEGRYDATAALWEEHPTLGVFTPFKDAFKGQVIVLINASTFSAAADFAAMLHFHQRATFIGEETGGSYIGNVSGYVPTLDLPHSSVKINLPLISIKHPFFDSHFTNRGVIPDHRVQPEIEAIRQRQDVVMRKAIHILHQ